MTAIVRRSDWLRWLRRASREGGLPPDPQVAWYDERMAARSRLRGRASRMLVEVEVSRLVGSYLRGRLRGAIERALRRRRRT